MSNEQLLVLLESQRMMLDIAIQQVRDALPNEFKKTESMVFIPNQTVETCPILQPLYDQLDILSKSIEILSKGVSHK